MSPLVVECIVSPPLETNTYLVADTETKRALAIDPSFVGDRMLERCKEMGWELERVVLTHEHIDHTRDAAMLAREAGCPVAAHEAAAEAVNDPIRSGALWLGIDIDPCAVAERLEEGGCLSLGEERLRVLHTPGHSPGSICLLGESVCFVGDLLFRDGVGRWDLPGGDQAILTGSMRRLVDKCSGKEVVYSGHGSETTVERERRGNPYLLEWLGEPS